MSHTHINQYVDIYQYPTEIRQLNNDTELTMGDLHASFPKALHFLAKEGIINISKDNYEKLIRCYLSYENKWHDDHLPLDQHIPKFHDLMKTITWNKEAIKLIRFIGDTLADRGKNDIFILAIFQKLHEARIPFTVLISNHDLDFIMAIERLSEKPEDPLYAILMGIPQQYASLCALNPLLQQNIITEEHLITTVKQYYNPHLKAIDYTLNKDKTAITLYTHAPFGIKQILTLAQRFHIPTENFQTLDQFTKIIDQINQQFENHVKDGSVSSIGSSETSTLFDITWGRDYKDLYDPQDTEKVNFNVTYVHGHDSDSPYFSKSHIINLDNTLGKSGAENWGPYTIYQENEVYSSFQEYPDSTNSWEETKEQEPGHHSPLTQRKISFLKQKLNDSLSKAYPNVASDLPDLNSTFLKLQQSFETAELDETQICLLTRQFIEKLEDENLYPELLKTYRDLGVYSILYHHGILLGRFSGCNPLIEQTSTYLKFAAASIVFFSAVTALGLSGAWIIAATALLGATMIYTTGLLYGISSHLFTPYRTFPYYLFGHKKDQGNYFSSNSALVQTVGWGILFSHDPAKITAIIFGILITALMTFTTTPILTFAFPILFIASLSFAAITDACIDHCARRLEDDTSLQQQWDAALDTLNPDQKNGLTVMASNNKDKASWIANNRCNVLRHISIPIIGITGLVLMFSLASAPAIFFTPLFSVIIPVIVAVFTLISLESFLFSFRMKENTWIDNRYKLGTDKNKIDTLYVTDEQLSGPSL